MPVVKKMGRDIHWHYPKIKSKIFNCKACVFSLQCFLPSGNSIRYMNSIIFKEELRGTRGAGNYLDAIYFYFPEEGEAAGSRSLALRAVLVLVFLRNRSEEERRAASLTAASVVAYSCTERKALEECPGGT